MYRRLCCRARIFQPALNSIVNIPGLLPQLQDQSRVLATLGLVPSVDRSDSLYAE